MITIYLLLQVILLILIIVSEQVLSNILLIYLLKLFPIILNLVFAFRKKLDKNLRYAFLSITIEDFIFLYLYDFTLGTVFFVIAQVLLFIYILKLYGDFYYLLFQPIFSLIFKLYYNPTILNKEYIPDDGPVVIAGNHKHALDPILVDVSTKRVVHTLAKKDLHDGIFGSFFRAIKTIPVDLNAEHNKEALEASIEYLNKGEVINLSPEAKRNYTRKLLLPFKYGAVVMAKRTNSKIIPYSITGDYKFRSKNLKICFGEPIDVSNMEIEDANKLLFDTIKKMIKDNRK